MLHRQRNQGRIVATGAAVSAMQALASLKFIRKKSYSSWVCVCRGCVYLQNSWSVFPLMCSGESLELMLGGRWIGRCSGKNFINSGKV
ncbi:hypothetical protein L2E82_30532 [Cichorium intybus]|uniref:Uncharacterized protein n=1 Tax=Cichorium intybus TaxID=13427 RepID=A0ACB9D0Z0_CICIN|nr:hypothetical protein L2E82_30532 [Cichorium intybus]